MLNWRFAVSTAAGKISHIAFIWGVEFQHDFIDNIGLLRIKIRTLLQFRIDLDERDINGVMIQVVSPTKEEEKTKDVSFASVTSIY